MEGCVQSYITIQQSQYTVKRIDSKLNCDRDGEYDLLRAE